MQISGSHMVHGGDRQLQVLAHYRNTTSKQPVAESVTANSVLSSNKERVEIVRKAFQDSGFEFEDYRIVPLQVEDEKGHQVIYPYVTFSGSFDNIEGNYDRYEQICKGLEAGGVYTGERILLIRKHSFPGDVQVGYGKEYWEDFNLRRK